MVAVEWLATLAATGAAALVGAAATDAWQSARAGFARLFGRGETGRQELAERRLDVVEAEIVEAAPDERDAVRQRHSAVWQTRLADLVEEHPELADELRALVADVTGQLPAGQRQWVQTNVARDHGTVFAVQGGDLHVTDRPPSPQE
ncbi:hypothetical protein Voc01_015330 [Virgisporangium ochraceum]|uniref:Uncharacterized protein n=1 Tax=Virgisporangium ochraceum TaxID=65505 RepID=A0A8J3ZMZ1_9ACTN|nr:hypothetical protein Voc01_015330 [Virgisporangium ochraceum]